MYVNYPTCSCCNPIFNHFLVQLIRRKFLQGTKAFTAAITGGYQLGKPLAAAVTGSGSQLGKAQAEGVQVLKEENQGTTQSDVSPVTIYVAQKIITMEAAQPEVKPVTSKEGDTIRPAVSVQGDTILAVGNLEQVKKALQELGIDDYTIDNTFEDKFILPIWGCVFEGQKFEAPNDTNQSEVVQAEPEFDPKAVNLADIAIARGFRSKKISKLITIAATLLTLIPNTKGHSAHAVTNTILQPTSVSSTLLETVRLGFRRLIDQTGLIDETGTSVSYTSGVDDFTSIVNTARHNGVFFSSRRRFRDNTSWANNITNLPVSLTFDLGDSYSINKFALWNENGTDAINNFELFADNDNNFDNGRGTSLLRSSANMVPNNSLAQVFSFAATQAQYVHLQINSNHGREGFIAPGEVAFAEVPFEFGPIPGIIGIVAVGGINYFRNKKRGKGERGDN